MAKMAGLEFAPHTWSGNGIGLVANLHVLGATHGAYLEFPYDPPSFVIETRDAMLAEPLRIDPDGGISLPQGPGLGIVLDFDKISSIGTPI
jgi:L-alanine-DL-glutamate epimerase-like enolase superfamily enzyme